MQRALFRQAAIALALLGSASLAAAQNTAQPEAANPPPAAPNETKKDPVPPATDKSEATRAGTQEPSSKIEGTAKHENSSFEKGTLAVPGAPTDVDTAPAKFSARTTADDAMPIAAYALKHLTDDQRRTIFASVGNDQNGQKGGDDFATIGAEVPTAVALTGLKPMPESITASIPDMKYVMFTRAGDKVMLINPRTRVVLAVLTP